MSEKKGVSGNIFDWKLLKRVINLARPYKRQFILATVLAILIAVLTPVRPFLFQIAIDDYVMKFNGTGLMHITLILIGLVVFESILRYVFIYSTRWLGAQVVKDLRVRVFDHITNLRLKFFDRTPIGTATTRTINDVEAINEVFSQGLITIFADLLLLLGIVFAMFAHNIYVTSESGNPNVWLALASLSTVPFFGYATYQFKEGIKKAFITVRRMVSMMNAFLQEHITGVKIIQIFNAEDIEMEKFRKINDDQKKAHIKAIWHYSIFFPIVEILTAVSMGLLVWIGANMVIQGTVPNVGVIISYTMYINMLFRPLRMLADRFNTLQMGLVAADRVFELMDSEVSIDNSGTHTLSDAKGSIQFNDVWFAYNNEDYVLKDISFDVDPGETVALVGATGAGKTSIINLLSRLYDINRGEISLDGINVDDYEISKLRSNIGVVLQDVFLFSGSVMENITLRDSDITKEQVIHAAKKVGAHDFISKLPGGYDFNVMERGATLSMGQRQLISFIRALVFDPRVLILDEATSSIDTESEILIQRAIDTLVSGRTSIVIAHRLSTIQKANKIIVLDQGEIKEMGGHAELIALDGWYKKLYDMQFSDNAA